MEISRVNPRNVAILVAVFYIIATAASVVGEVLTVPHLKQADYLTAIAANATSVTTAAFFYIFAIIGVVGIPIYLFPILERYSSAGAFWYLVIRIFEGLMFTIGTVSTLVLVRISGVYVEASVEKASYLADLGAVIREFGEVAYTTGIMIFFSISAIVLGVMLYKTRLVPAWLSIWKVVGAILLLVQGTLILFEAATPMLESTLFLPIAVNEMVLALWLLFKGFDRDALERLGFA